MGPPSFLFQLNVLVFKTGPERFHQVSQSGLKIDGAEKGLHDEKEGTVNRIF